MKYELMEKIGFSYVKKLLVCVCVYGEEQVKKLAPFTDKNELQTEFDNIYRAINTGLDKECTARLLRLFMPIKDIRRSIRSLGEGTADEVSLFEIKRFLLQIKEIIPAYADTGYNFCGINIPECTGALEHLCIDGNYSVGFYISDMYSERLKEIRVKKKEIEQYIRAADLKDVDELKHKRLLIADEEALEETRIREQLSKDLAPYKEDMLLAAEAIGRIDLILAKAKLAIDKHAVCPVIADETMVEFINMRNPYIEYELEKKGRSFTPVTMCAQSGSTVITGANMGGKSVALKTLALNAYAALCGMYVFAEKGKLPLFEDISVIAEDSEDVKNGLSSFGGEMLNLKSELANTDKCTLLLFDELARGTNPQEGARIMKAVVRHLNGKRAVSVLTTHYDGVAPLAKRHYRVIGLRDFSFSGLRSSLENGVEAISQHMNYGLYEADASEECPKEAIEICRFLLQGEPLLDEILRS